MLNITVPAAATGLPSTNRRSFLAGSSAAAAGVALPVAACANVAPDPALRAIAAWKPVRAKYEAALDAAGRAGEAACRRAGPRPTISFRGRSVDGVGEFFVRRFFSQFDLFHDREAVTAQHAALAASADYKVRKGEADAIERVDELQAIAQDWCHRECEALTIALTTTATSLAGLHAVIRLIAAEPAMLGECTDEATASLATAANALLPDLTA